MSSSGSSKFINHITSSPLSNTILPEGHHRPPSRDLTTHTRKHPGHTQCLLTSHNHPSMMRVRKLAEEPWTQESWTHPQLSTAQLVQMMEEMVTLSNFVLNGVNYLRVQGTAMDTGMASLCANLFMAELCRRTCSTGQQKNRAYGGDTLMISLQSGTDGQIYHRHFSNNQQVTPHHPVHRRMTHGPGDIPKNHHGDPIQTQKT